ncbi:DUF6279 family lipoprotein [Endozoicomonas gorgoniicola]|uniref:DUF6279 family lipoprotein n=1 Tax=Endozoicomonas gorgoniicola TaxID=1234144 RepID=A0ABT3MZE9_9GAMM|nr:DUF6279 family lipoprotein [Endozoicomonas gorgoniicola]MCW7554755.1 DUF6279 family lipoprotein [Endozoicomonas gorgoniicola]
MNTLKRVCGFFLLFLLPFLHSCSTSYVYDNLDWLVHWYVDDYVELTPRQKKEFDQRFSQLQRWHKENELQEYQQWLESIREQLLRRQLSPEEISVYVRSHRQKTLVFWDRLVTQAEPHLLQLLEQLSEKQRQNLIENIRRQMLKRYETRLTASRTEWEKDKVARMEKGLKPWIGSLSQDQKKRLNRWASSLHNVDKLNREFRLDWLTRLIDLQPLPLSERRGKLSELVANPERFRTPEHLQFLKENRELTDAAIAEVIALRSNRQNNTALAEIDQWLRRIKNSRG